MKIETKELSFLKNDPGAVKHGNFINYYSFNSVQSRLSHLDYEMFPMPETDNIVVLDVGCNSGDLTYALYHYIMGRYGYRCTVNVLGIDLDPKLISKAQKENSSSSNIEYKVGNIMDNSGRSMIRQYLQKHGKQYFDFTFCFSITMWIHLNNGDAGLLDFLKYIQSISTSFIIEPQTWKCYKSAQRRLKKAGGSFEKFNTLKIREIVHIFIENTIKKQGYFCKTFETQLTVWGRAIQCYRAKEDFLDGDDLDDPYFEKDVDIVYI